jgi:hypothetical protein
LAGSGAVESDAHSIAVGPVAAMRPQSSMALLRQRHPGG